jgi:hypothetical protein
MLISFFFQAYGRPPQMARAAAAFSSQAATMPGINRLQEICCHIAINPSFVGGLILCHYNKLFGISFAGHFL